MVRFRPWLSFFYARTELRCAGADQALERLPELRSQPEYIRHTLWYDLPVKHYVWDPAKNEKLKRERGVSFEDVVFHIEAGDEVDLLEHPNQQRYPGQKISVVLIEGYAYLVPFVESETEIFLKTIILSRKASRQYLGESDEQT
jgi:uncharacterized DUF497 family protein